MKFNQNTYLREPCAVIREDGREASAAAPVDWDIEHRKRCGLGCRGFRHGRRQYVHHRYGERMDGPTVSKTPDTQAHTLSGPGRSSYCPAFVQDREGKVATPKPEMYGMKKSDVGIVATNAANKRVNAPAEQRERRPAREGKSGDPNMRHAQTWVSVTQGIERLRKFATRFSVKHGGATRARSHMR